MEKIYVVISKTSDGVSTMVCDTSAEAKAGFITFFESNPNADRTPVTFYCVRYE